MTTMRSAAWPVACVCLASVIAFGEARAGDPANEVVSVARHPVLALLADRTETVPEPPAGKVALGLGAAYLPEALPGAGLTFHVPSSEADSLWAQESLPEGEGIPAGEEIADNVLFLAPGEERMVTVAYRNPTDKAVRFMVLPHRESPAALAPHTWLTCLCMSFVYEAPAKGGFYRVIRVKAGPKMPPGSRVAAVWTVLTDPAVFPE